jgi:16S rRNA (uracil1498-N3)-methyltransferase
VSRTWRVYHPHELPGAGAVVSVDAEEAHYVVRVLRLRPGEPLALFDGRGREWVGRLVESAARGVRVELERERLDPIETPLPVTLLQGLSRPERMEWVIQKGTEIGLAGVLAVRTERCERLRGTGRRLERWRKVALEACRQSGRRRLPEVDLLDALPAAGDGEALALLLQPGAEAASLAASCPAEPPSAVRLAVGPEGGFSAAESARSVESGWRGVHLGPRILRTETAGLVAASILLHRWADLGA